MSIGSISTVRLTYAQGESGPTSILGVPLSDCELLVNRHLDLAAGNKVTSDLMVWSYRLAGRGKDQVATNGKQVLVRLNNVSSIEVGTATAVQN